jgi:transglutaminase-like putative cysteine protease
VAGTAPATEGWEALAPGELLMLRRGVVADAVAGPAVVLPPRRRRVPSMPDGERVMDVLHETTYRYDAPVARSSHTLRLEPVHDRLQEVLRHEVTLSVGGARSRYEDVFGNLSHAVEIDTPYEELTVRSESRVLLRSGPDPRRTVGGNPRMPLMWMPWQRQMLLSYLLPPELPETQLRELNDYALSFARRNDGSVIATLWDVNETIHRDYAYVSGSTSLETTPFDVYVTRRGVCQDFANLFICLARLLGVPARYRVGYIHTGADYANRIQSDASHAWCEMYLPWLGWVGLDPTNGCLAGLDHVRVACGRNFLDATPTAGTIWQGGGGERLQVRVEVVPREAPAPAGAGA